MVHCVNCRYFVCRTSEDSGVLGECHYNPPQILLRYTSAVQRRGGEIWFDRWPIPDVNHAVYNGYWPVILGQSIACHYFESF